MIAQPAGFEVRRTLARAAASLNRGSPSPSGGKFAATLNPERARRVVARMRTIDAATRRGLIALVSGTGICTVLVLVSLFIRHA